MAAAWLALAGWCSCLWTLSPARPLLPSRLVCPLPERHAARPEEARPLGMAAAGSFLCRRCQGWQTCGVETARSANGKYSKLFHHFACFAVHVLAFSLNCFRFVLKSSPTSASSGCSVRTHRDEASAAHNTPTMYLRSAPSAASESARALRAEWAALSSCARATNHDSRVRCEHRSTGDQSLVSRSETNTQ